VFDTVNLLSMTPIMEASNLEERLQQLDLITATMKNREEIAGLQIGYENGDYFIIRPTSSNRLRSLFDAPDNTAFMADNIVTDAVTSQRFLERVFFDESMKEIWRKPPEATEYDPRTRPWYLQAVKTGRVAAVAPYLFYFLKEIGTTVFYAPTGKKAVIAADVTLKQLSATLVEYLPTPGSKIALLSPDGYVLGYNQPERTIVRQEDEHVKIARLDELDSNVLAFVKANELLQPGTLSFSHEGRDWHGAVRTFNVSGSEGRDMTLVMLSPRDELLADVIRRVKISLLITIGILLISIPLVSFVARMISKALYELSEEAALISRFDFNKPFTLRSKIREVNELARSMALMKSTISRFLSLIKSLASEQNFDAMLEQITEETLHVSGAEGVLTWLVDDTTETLNPVAFFGKGNGKIDLDGLPSFAVNGEQALAEAARLANVSQWNTEGHAD
jgi:hypothetical protein